MADEVAEAVAAGLIRVTAAAIDAVNGIDEAVTIATLTDYAPVVEGQIVATVKIIPYAVNAAVMDKVRFSRARKAVTSATMVASAVSRM